MIFSFRTRLISIPAKQSVPVSVPVMHEEEPEIDEADLDYLDYLEWLYD